MKVKIQIKSYFGTVLFEAEKEDYTVKRAVQDAVLQGADLQGAVLQGADLQGAVLQGADLQGAVLRGAVLQDAVLRGADLQGADLQGAVLQGADLQGAVLRGAVLRGVKNLPQLYVNICSRDMLFVFEHLKSELPFLRKALIEGKVNGTQYSGECACLIGTLAHAKGIERETDMRDKFCPAIPFYEMGLDNPGEQWFWQIRQGDTPEKSEFASHAVKLIDMVLGKRVAAKKRGRPRKVETK